MIVAVSAHLVGMHSAMKMLVGRLGVLCSVLQKMDSGEIPFDHDLVRKISSLTNRLPVMDGGSFPENFLTVIPDNHANHQMQQVNCQFFLTLASGYSMRYCLCILS